MGEILDLISDKIGEPPRETSPRRLAAIVVGDIADYSCLMELDEERTHGRVKRIERDLIKPSIAEHYGRLVKTTGDGFIAIFDSPVEAVRSSIVIQRNMVGRNAALPKHHWIEYRIGVNLGDVIIEADDIYGDGVNVASRFENIADPGQVYISGGVYEQIKNKLVCGYESLGDRKVKDITDPVRVYRVLPDPAAFNMTRKRREKILLFLLSLALLSISGGALWYLLLQPHDKTQDQASISVSPETPNAPQSLSVRSVTPTKQQPAPASRAAPGAAPTQQSATSAPEPEMNALRGGSFIMGSNDEITEKPTRQVTVKPFSMSKYPITVREWNQCSDAKACALPAAGKDDAPATNVSWSDAKQFVAWLAATTGKPYRLPSEAEWEYAARGGTQTNYWWGDQMQTGMANCNKCSEVAAAEQPVKVGSFKPNPFGLYDMGGEVDQWVEDCWHKNYQGARSDGSPWVEADCVAHVIRSGSWRNDARYVRPANRDSYDTNVRYPTHGLRVVLSL
jgi:formylglycine-generating enzyme required for sulfatase activity/class 3 adenylate cyclase